jgi:hypothetical protein
MKKAMAFVAVPLLVVLAQPTSASAQLNGTGAQSEAQRPANQALLAEVSAFAGDAQHPYFYQIRERMAELIKTGRANSFQDAYEMAADEVNPSRGHEDDYHMIAKYNDSVLLVKPDQIERLRGHLTARYTVAFISPYSSQNFDYVVIGAEIDCASRRSAFLSLYSYKRDGRQVGGGAVPTQDVMWMQVTHPSQVELVVGYACGSEAYRSGVGLPFHNMTIDRLVDTIRQPGWWPAS